MFCMYRFICILHTYIAACISEVQLPSRSITCRVRWARGDPQWVILAPIKDSCHTVSPAELSLHWMRARVCPAPHKLTVCSAIISFNPYHLPADRRESSTTVKLNHLSRWNSVQSAGDIRLKVSRPFVAQICVLVMISHTSMAKNLLLNQLQTRVLRESSRGVVKAECQ